MVLGESSCAASAREMRQYLQRAQTEHPQQHIRTTRLRAPAAKRPPPASHFD